MENILINQGSFVVPAGGPVITSIPVRSGFDWVKVWNYDQFAGSTANAGLEFYWQRGMPMGSALVKYSNGASAVMSQLFTTGGIYFADSSITTPILSVAQVITNVTNATQPIFSTGGIPGSTLLLNTGSIVRVERLVTAAPGSINPTNVEYIDFEVDTVVVNTSFRMRWALANAPGFTGGATAGFYRVIPYPPIYYPRNRFIANITALGTQFVVTTTVAHGYTINQVVRFTIPAAFGMTDLNGLTGVITAVNTTLNTFTVTLQPPATITNVFRWPNFSDATQTPPFNFAQVTPVGDNSDATILDGAGNPMYSYLANDATRNEAALYLVLGTGDGTITGPSGDTAGDTMYWLAGKNYLI